MIKKWIAVVMAAVLVLLCAGCHKNVPETNPTGEDTSAFMGVCIQILNVETTEKETILHVQWQNDSGYPIMYGESFGLQRWEQDQWVNCPMKENTGFISIGYKLDPGKSVIKSYTLNWAFGELTPGKYQFFTSCHVMLDGKYEECKLSDEFVLEETVDNKAPINGRTELYIAGEALGLDSERSKTVRMILSALVFSEEAVCDCMPEYELVLDGDSYGIHLEEGYVRCEKGQATLDSQQLKELSAIIDWALEETKAR